MKTVKNNQQLRNKHAKCVINKAEKYLKYGLSSYPNKNGDEGIMVKMYKDDYKDLIKLAKFIKQNKLGHAIAVIERVDTAVREEVPVSVYNWVYGVKYPEYC